jgi:hypothetical protein
MSNVRYSQFSPTAAILHNNSNITSGYRFTDDGTGIAEYAYGFRGGTGQNVINGDGPLLTSGTSMQTENERRTLFTSFEFDFTDTTTGYVQGNFALMASPGGGTACAKCCVRRSELPNIPSRSIHIADGRTTSATSVVGVG